MEPTIDMRRKANQEERNCEPKNPPQAGRTADGRACNLAPVFRGALHAGSSHANLVPTSPRVQRASKKRLSCTPYIAPYVSGKIMASANSIWKSASCES